MYPEKQVLLKFKTIFQVNPEDCLPRWSPEFGALYECHRVRGSWLELELESSLEARGYGNGERGGALAVQFE